MRSHRIAVVIFFFVNGFLHANLMARLPSLQQSLHISNTVLGSLLFAIALGALLAMPVTGWLTTIFGSAKVTMVTGILFCIAIPIIPMATHLWLLRFWFFFLGISTGSMDVAMNGQAVWVEQEYKKPIMSSFHAWFSIGMATGAGTGALFSNFQISLAPHLLGMSMVALIAILYFSNNLMKIAPNPTAHASEKQNWMFLKLIQLVLPLGLIAFASMTTEGSMADWSAIYMRKIIGQNLVTSALAFGVFAAGMTLGRIFGDYFTFKLGYQRLLLLDAVAAIAGLALLLSFHFVWTAFLGLFIIGLGVATIVPIVFSTAGNTKGIQPSVGIAAATSIGYLGFFIGPPVIGYLADAYNLRIGLFYTLFLLIMMLLLIIWVFKKKE